MSASAESEDESELTSPPEDLSYQLANNVDTNETVDNARRAVLEKRHISLKQFNDIWDANILTPDFAELVKSRPASAFFKLNAEISARYCSRCFHNSKIQLILQF